MTQIVKIVGQNSIMYVLTTYYLIISQQVTDLSTIFISKRDSLSSDYLLSKFYPEDGLLCITAVAVITNVLCRQEAGDAM